MAKRKRRGFTDEYKAEVVELIRKSRKGIRAISRELDLTETAVRRWVKQAEIDSGVGPTGALTTAEREELAKLRKRVKTLEMEREILRKATLSIVALPLSRRPWQPFLIERRCSRNWTTWIGLLQVCEYRALGLTGLECRRHTRGA